MSASIYDHSKCGVVRPCKNCTKKSFVQLFILYKIQCQNSYVISQYLHGI